MGKLCLSAVLILALCGCDDLARLAAKRRNSAAGNGTESAAASARSSGFPRAGLYDIVHESMGRREASDMWVDASTPQGFEALVASNDGSNCRDRHVSIGGGAFSVSMTCDAPDGDIHNIRSQRSGSYSENSIEIRSETILWGSPIRETTSYRFRRS